MTEEAIEITDDNFEMAMSQVSTAFHMLALFDWAKLIEQRRSADSFMHITDPTGYLKLINSENAANNFEAAQAARDYVAALKRIAGRPS